MKTVSGLTLSACIFVGTLLLHLQQPSWAYEANWKSLDSRPIPDWYPDAKFGIFIHWGVFSVPAFKTEWFWWDWKGGYDGKGNKASFEEFVNASETQNFAYQDYAKRFDAQFYDPQEWADIFAESGAQYVVLTSKHHEGFCNWDSRSIPATWGWNAMDVGPRRDLVGDLAKAVKKTTSNHTKHKLKFGLYHSLFEWFNPLYMQDLANNFSSTLMTDTKTIPELYDLVKKYEPELIWSDGSGKGRSDYWKATQFLAWYATNSTVNQTAVWNDRWGRDCDCKHGSFFTCKDGFRPSTVQPFKWENCYTLDASSWGYNRKSHYKAYRTVEGLVHLLAETVAFNGNLLLNIGPRADGTIPPIFVDRLVGMGEWLKVNGEAIYGSKPWSVCQNETASSVFYTTQRASKTLYAIFTQWPKDNKLRLSYPTPTADINARLIGFHNNSDNETDNMQLTWRKMVARQEGNDVLLSREQGETHLRKDGIEIDLPFVNPSMMPCKHAWVLALTGVGNFGASLVLKETS